MINRRDALGLLAGSFAGAVLPSLAASDAPERPARTGLGIVVYCCQLRRRSMATDGSPDLFEPARFLAHCRQLGAGGVQIPLGILDRSAAHTLRRQADAADLFIEAIISPPYEPADVESFDAQMRTAVEAGAKAVRTTIIPGRRYEEFDSLERFRQFEARGRRALERAAPIAERHRLPLAVENHKDHRNDERVTLFEAISSQYVGACVDTGNSFALLEDPIETVEALAPWAHSVHLKDQAVQLYDDGFLLGDIPLGQGFLELGRMVKILRRQKPDIRFTLELITRDPLKVPCLGEKFWATLPDVPGSHLARSLRAVRSGATDNLQYVSALAPRAQVELEDANVRASLDYARERLAI